MNAPENQVVIVGAGTSGLSVALCLSDLSVKTLVLDRGNGVGAAWRTRYGLTLNTTQRHSHLPKRPYPKGTPLFPSRDQVVAHLEEHSTERGIDLRLDTPVERIVRRKPSGWGVVTADGIIGAAHVVVATGYAHTPILPDWPGVEEFTGQVLHSAHYRDPGPYAGRRVLVVGAGSSGLEIAHALAAGGSEKVWLSVRTPPNLLPRNDGAFRLRLTRHPRDTPTVVDQEVIDAMQDRSIEVVDAVTSFDGAAVVLTDRTRLDVDVVIAATGYRPGLEPLVGQLGVLTDAGVPTADGDVAAEKGLWFLGLRPRPSLIRHSSGQSERLAGRIAREIAEAGRPKKNKLF